jgi:hypothetical protein
MPADSKTAEVLEDVREAAEEAGVFADCLDYGDLVTPSAHGQHLQVEHDPAHCWVAVKCHKAAESSYNFWVMWVTGKHQKVLQTGQKLTKFTGYYLELYHPPGQLLVCQTGASLYRLEKVRNTVADDLVVHCCFKPKLARHIAGGAALFSLDPDDYHSAMLGVGARLQANH